VDEEIAREGVPGEDDVALLDIAHEEALRDVDRVPGIVDLVQLRLVDRWLCVGERLLKGIELVQRRNRAGGAGWACWAWLPGEFGASRHLRWLHAGFCHRRWRGPRFGRLRRGLFFEIRIFAR